MARRLLGDLAYRSGALEDALAETGILLVTERSRQHGERQQVEIVFANLKREFRLGETLARTLTGPATRIAAKIAAFTYGFLVNRMLDRPQERIKEGSRNGGRRPDNTHLVSASWLGTTSGGTIRPLFRTVSMPGMGSSVERIRVHRPPAPRRPPARKPPARRGSGAPEPIPKRASGAFERARRRRRVARRVACVLALCFVAAPLSYTAFNRDAPSPEREHLVSMLPVKTGTLLASPEPPPGMHQVWAAAAAEDPWPDLATGGSVGTFENRIALTFDDGPDPQTTPLILDTLRKRGVEATFFVVGRQVAKNPGLLRRIVAEGHTVGNHTYDHADMSGLSLARMHGELRSTQEAVDDALGYHHPMALMRPPYGNPYVEGSNALPAFQEVVRAQELIPVIWTVDPSDYLLDDNPDGVIRAVARADKVGAKGEADEVVLLHDNQRQTAEALPGIIDHYEASGRGFVGVDELLADKYLEP